MDDWVPKKLEVSIEFDPQQNFDFNRFQSTGVNPGEKLMPSDAVADEGEVEPELNMEIVNQLLQMGIPEV